MFHSASRQPLLPHYQSLQPAHAHHRLSTQRQQSSPDIRSSDSGFSGASAPPSAKSHPLQLDTSLMNPCVSRAASTPAPRLLSITLSQVQGAVPAVLPSPPAPCPASVPTARCKCRTAPTPCPPPLPHMLVLRPKIILIPLSHVFECTWSTWVTNYQDVVSSPLAPCVPGPPFSRLRSHPFTHHTL